MPSFFVDVWGWSPLAAGFGLAPAALIGAVLSPFAGRLADRIGHRELVAAGCALAALGRCGGCCSSTTTPAYSTAMLPGMVLGGLGIVGGFATLTGALMSRVPPRFYSMAGAARSTIFQLATADRHRRRRRPPGRRNRRRRRRGPVPQRVARGDRRVRAERRRDAGRVPPPRHRPGRIGRRLSGAIDGNFNTDRHMAPVSEFVAARQVRCAEVCL